MTTDLGPARPPAPDPARTAAGGAVDARTVTVLAPLAGPGSQGDLERPDAGIADVLQAVVRHDDQRAHRLVPLRRKVQPGPYRSSLRRDVELLDATSLEDVASALGDTPAALVHAIGWEAGVVAAALGSSGAGRATVLLEPLGVPGSPEWSLVEHAAVLLLRSERHRQLALRRGVPRQVVTVLPPTSPTGPGPVPLPGGEQRRLAVVGDAVDAMLLAAVERLLRASPGVQVVFAGEAARLVHERRCAVVVRSWPAGMVARVHSTPEVGWPVLARVDALLDVGGMTWTPRAALAAMATGRPVVALLGRPAEDVVVRGLTGLVVGADPSRIGTALAGLLGDPALLDRLGGSARERWESEHAPEVRARRLAELYDRLDPGDGS